MGTPPSPPLAPSWGEIYPLFLRKKEGEEEILFPQSAPQPFLTQEKKIKLKPSSVKKRKKKDPFLGPFKKNFKGFVSSAPEERKRALNLSF